MTLSANITSITDALNNKTTYSYDAFKRRTSVTQPDPDGPTNGANGRLAAPVLKTVYNADGSVHREIDALGNVTQFKYDELGRTIEVIAADPSGPGTQSASPITRYTYNPAGELTSMTETDGRSIMPRRDLTTAISITRLTPHLRRNGRSAASPLGAFTANNGTVIVQLGGSTANGRLVADAVRVVEGAVTETVYNKAGNVTSTVDALGNAITCPFALVFNRTV